MIHRYVILDSTMHAAIRLPLGDVVVADEQTAGQGRHGHSWHSERRAGLYCSIVLRPHPVLTLALGLATADAISQTAGLSCDLRWPNDVMLNGRKVAGILVQLIDDRAIAGIGINVNHTRFPPELERDATSLLMASGRPIDRDALLDALLAFVDRFTQFDQPTILRLFTHASSYALGRRVTVDQPGGRIVGVTQGLDEAGYLKVRQDDGTDTLILAGGVRAAGS
ncbi:MAG TPA: biotin--[acetyl-CoA-carboxylase] ligase [Bryobacteraceae bacterium]